MKKLAVILLLVCFFFQAFSPVVIIVSYYLHKGYITKNLCENRNNPKVHCDGKCYLKKKLAQNSKDESPSSLQNKKVGQFVLFFEKAKLELPLCQLEILVQHHDQYKVLALMARPGFVFHPPPTRYFV